MFQQIGNLLVESVFGFIIFLLLLRFYMQAFRAPFRNPVGELVSTLTNWLVRPARRFIPGLYGLDLSSLVLAWVLDVLMLFLLSLLGGALPSASGPLIRAPPDRHRDRPGDSFLGCRLQPDIRCP